MEEAMRGDSGRFVLKSFAIILLVGLFWCSLISLGGTGVSAGSSSDNLEAPDWVENPIWDNTLDGDNFRTPDWVKNAIFYQILPYAFRNGSQANDPKDTDWYLRRENIHIEAFDRDNLPPGMSHGKTWFGGDLQGIREKIPYLENLGVNAVYLNPTFDSTQAHGYSVINYKSVNRYFGVNHRENGRLILDYENSLDVFENMMESFTEHDMRVILDGVFNHCSAKNSWFDIDNEWPNTLGAYESKKSPYYNWFEFKKWPEKYVNYGSDPLMITVMNVKGFRESVFGGENSVLGFWDNYGVDGWRLDTADGQPHSFWQKFRENYKQIDPKGYIVGEIGGDPSTWLQGDEFDSTMNYHFRNAVISWAGGVKPTIFHKKLKSREDYPKEAFYASFNLLGSHDRIRALSALDDNVKRMKLAVIFQMTYPGAPVIYYGDEIGMRGGTSISARCPYPWPDSGQERILVRPALRVPFEPNMDLFHHYQKLIEIRKKYSVLRTGSLHFKKAVNENNLYILERYDDSNHPRAVLIYNNGSEPQQVELQVDNFLPDRAIIKDVLNENEYVVKNGKLETQVKGMWANVLLWEKGDLAKSSEKPSQGLPYLYIIPVIIALTIITTWILKRRES